MTHYYDSSGNPAYEIVGKNGKKRTPYVKEAKELGLVPGVTSISGQLANEAIVQWSTSTVINICMHSPFCEMGASTTEWITSIKNKFREEKDRITGQGHVIHDALEKYYKTGKLVDKTKEFVVPVIEIIERTWPMLQRTDWQAERSFNYDGLYGGKVDLSTEHEKGIILDFKTKDTDDVVKYKAYESHKQQLIAYAYGLKIPQAKCGDIFLSALTPNIVKLDMQDNLDIHWRKFKVLLKYWHLENYGVKIL